MMFLNAAMLAGIGAAALPLALHLLSRARHRRVDWAAMMFLEEASARPMHAARIKQWVLLGLRMGILTMLAVALARPVAANRRGAASADANAGPMTVAIVIDCSGSMAIAEQGRPRMEWARAAGLEILSTCRAGDRAVLIPIGAAPAEDLPRGEAAEGFGGGEPIATSDHSAVAQRLSRLTASSDRADVARGLDQALGVLERLGPGRREIHLVVDHQASNWAGMDVATTAEIRRRLTGLDGREAALFVYPIGHDAEQNVGIESLAVLNPPAIVDQPIEVEARIRNYGSGPRRGIPLSWQAQDRPVPRSASSLNLEAGESVTVRAQVRIGEAGSKVLGARIEAGALASDDRMERAVEVIKPIRVLIIRGDERPGEEAGDRDFAKMALTPFAAAHQAKGRDPAVVKTLAASAWREVDRKDEQVVILANVAQITASQAKSLERFVYEGGGLLIAPGNLSRVENYNALLVRDGAGIMPATLGAATSADAVPTTIGELDLDHPVFSFVRGRADALPRALIRRHFAASPRRAARVLGSYVGKEPFLIEGSFGSGRVLLMTTSLDGDWTGLPLGGFYLPMLQSAVRYLADGALPNRNLRPGEELRAVLPGPIERARLYLPDGREVKDLEITKLGGEAEIRSMRTWMPGRYTLRIGDRTTLQFVLAATREESDLTALTPGRWDTLISELGMMRIDLTEPRAIAEATASSRRVRELWPAALGLVAALLIGELALARRWTGEPAAAIVPEAPR